MIPRINQPRLVRHDKRLAFGRGDAARPLRIFIDSNTVTDSEWLQLLFNFSGHDHVEIVTLDGRSPIHMTIGPYDPARQMADVVIETPDGTRTHSAVWGPDYPRLAQQFSPGDVAAGERAILLAIAAEEHGSDALVTESPALLTDYPRNIVGGSNPMSAREAVALLGLFLRLREDFVFDMSGSLRLGFNRGLFYFVLMRQLLPSAWRWFSACVDSSQATGDDALLLTAQSALERTERALRARDRMQERLQLPPSRDAATEAIFYFDVALVMLGGAFDVLARIAHITHHLNGSPRSGSWGSESWAKKLAKANAALADAMAPGQPHRDARELVAVLRNTIHSQALRTVTHVSGGQRDELVRVPSDIEQELEDALNRLATPADFGVERKNDGHLYIEPGVYIEKALPLVAEALNAIMDMTAVEQLPQVNAANLLAGPPADPNDQTFSPAIHERAWQLGGIG